jgi:hypothetical protein
LRILDDSRQPLSVVSLSKGRFSTGFFQKEIGCFLKSGVRPGLPARSAGVFDEMENSALQLTLQQIVFYTQHSQHVAICAEELLPNVAYSCSVCRVCKSFSKVRVL